MIWQILENSQTSRRLGAFGWVILCRHWVKSVVVRSIHMTSATRSFEGWLSVAVECRREVATPTPNSDSWKSDFNPCSYGFNPSRSGIEEAKIGKILCVKSPTWTYLRNNFVLDNEVGPMWSRITMATWATRKPDIGWKKKPADACVVSQEELRKRCQVVRGHQQKAKHCWDDTLPQ